MGGGEQSNAATYFVVLKNWDERKGKKHTAAAIVDRFNMEAYGIQEAEVFAMVPPAIPGLGATGGLQLQLEDRNNLGATEMQRAVETLMEKLPQLSGFGIRQQPVSGQCPPIFPEYRPRQSAIDGHTVEQCFHGFRVLYGRSLR